MRRPLRASALALALIAAPAGAADGDGVRLQADAFTHLGSFALPSGQHGGSRFGYGGRGLAPHTEAGGRRTLFIGGHAWDAGHVAQVAIPSTLDAPGRTGAAVATVVQPFADVSDGRMGDISGGNPMVYGLLAYGGRLVVGASEFYDAAGQQTRSHGSSPLTLSARGDFRGFHAMDAEANPRSLGGWMTLIPPEWRRRLGGPALTGNGGLSIISASSCGPAATVFDPDDVGVRDPVPATTLLFYPLAHPLADPVARNEHFTLATQFGGMAFPTGSRSLLVIGRHGTGEYGYGQGTDDPALHGRPTGEGSVYVYDPVDGAKGTHAYPYRHQVWAYDALDLEAVRAGTKQPWELRPYAVWPLPGMAAAGAATIRSAAYDQPTGLLYVTTAFGEEARVHVWRITVPASGATTAGGTSTAGQGGGGSNTSGGAGTTSGSGGSPNSGCGTGASLACLIGALAFAVRRRLR